MSDIYNFTTASAEVILALGNRSDIASRVTAWLNAAQARLAMCNVELKRLETTDTARPITANTQEYTLGTLLLNPCVGIRQVKNEGTGVGLWRFNFDDYRRLVNQAVSPPVRWARYGSRFVIDPIPDVNTTFRFDYRRYPTTGVLEVDNDLQEVVIDITIWLGAGRLGMDDVAKSAFQRLPVTIQAELQRPLRQEDLELLWSEPSLVSGFGPYSVHAGG